MAGKNVDIDVKVLGRKGRGICVWDGAVTGWVGKSLISDPDLDELQMGWAGTITIPEWKAKECGFI